MEMSASFNFMPLSILLLPSYLIRAALLFNDKPCLPAFLMESLPNRAALSTSPEQLRGEIARSIVGW
jgi:hypothetical protein